jgi:hypothetical protein
MSITFPRVFIAESLHPDDFYEERLDGLAASRVLLIDNSQVRYRTVFDLQHLRRALQEAAHELYDVFHLSCHGSDDGIELTDGEFIDWLSLAELLKSFSGEHRLLVMSCCNGGHVGLTKALEKAGAVFGWVFGSTTDEVNFTDSCIAWSVLYRKLLAADLCTRDVARATVDILNHTLEGRFVCREWIPRREKFQAYPAFKPVSPAKSQQLASKLTAQPEGAELMAKAVAGA